MASYLQIGRAVNSQWRRSVLRLQWGDLQHQFAHPHSTVNHQEQKKTQTKLLGSNSKLTVPDKRLKQLNSGAHQGLCGVVRFGDHHVRTV